MTELIEKIRNSWDDRGSLSSLLIELCERQLELGVLIATQEHSYSSAFVNDRGESFKGTDSLSRERAKLLVGSSKTQYEYEFETLNNLIKIVTLRISLVQ